MMQEEGGGGGGGGRERERKMVDGYHKFWEKNFCLANYHEWAI